jgi:Tol biopolymer transport system component
VTSIEDLWKTFSILKDKGIDLETIAPNVFKSLSNLVKNLDESGIAVKKWTKEGATTAIKNLRGLANNLEETKNPNITKE